MKGSELVSVHELHAKTFEAAAIDVMDGTHLLLWAIAKQNE